jgi:trans-2,3-dihydro-3-hydroxyanthranilate isomerase
VSTPRQLFSETSDPGGVVADGGTIEYTVLDVFAANPLEGNQLAVFADGRGLEGAEMQRIAREMNLSETVFLLPAEADGDARIRIFTPTSELPFAGHPILGTAFVMAEALGTGSVRIETGLGSIPVDLEREGARLVFGRMQQPIPEVEPYERAGDLLEALHVAKSELPIESYRNGPRHVFVMLATGEDVTALRPDFSALTEHGGVGVNCFARVGDHWKARMFAPALGVFEDPATGSAAGPLALHLARHGQIAFGDEIEIRQGEEILRPSVLRARVIGDATTVERVEVGGCALVVARGHYLVRSARSPLPG